MTSQIFISYSKKDKDFAWKLADDLVFAGHKVWIDRSLQVGEDWKETIIKRLEEADEVIVILSSNAISSKWVQHEGSMAYGLKKKMYPVLIEALPAEELPLWMNEFQYHSFINVNYELAFDGLNIALTPPNPIQDLLDQQVNVYRQTGSLMGIAILQVIEETKGTLRIDETAEELIEKSNQALQAEREKELEQRRNLEKTRRQRTAALTSGMIIALILSVFSFFLYQRAEERAIQAQSRQLAAIASSKIEDDFHLAVLLSVESIRKDVNFLSRDSVLTVVQYNPNMMRSLDRHIDSVYSVAFSPNGRILASAGWDGMIRLWDVETGQQIGKPLTGHTDEVFSVAFSPDGKTLVSGSEDETIRLWDLEAGQQIWNALSGHKGIVFRVVFSPDGKTLASGGRDATIRLWDVETGQQIGEALSGHKGVVFSVAFSPDGKTLASGSDDNTVRLWDVKTGQQIGDALSGHTKGVSSVAFSPDGKILASGSLDKTIRLWNVKIGQQIGEALIGHAGDVSSIAFSPDGKTLASSGDWDETIRLWDVETGQHIGEVLIGHAGKVSSVTFSPDGKILASGGYDDTVRLWDVSKALNTGLEPRQLLGKAFIGNGENVYSVAISPDGKTLASGGDDNTIRLWDISIFLNEGVLKSFNTNLDRGQQIGGALIGHADSIDSVAFSPDGKILASGSSDKTIRLWDVKTGQQIGEALTGHTSSVQSVAFSPNGKILASGSWDRTIRLWDVETGLEVGEPMIGNVGPVRSVAFSPDGKKLASGSLDRTIRLWNVKTGLEIGEPMIGHMDFVYSVAFSPDGKILVSGSMDETIRMWDTETGQQIGEALTGHTSRVSSVVFRPDGKVLASASLDQIILWDVETRQQIGETIDEFTIGNNSLTFSPDGKILASGSYQGIIGLWDVSIEALISRACERVSRNLTETEWNTYFPGECYRVTCLQFPAEFDDQRPFCQQ